MDISTDIRHAAAKLAMDSNEIAVMAETLFGRHTEEYWALVANWRKATETYHQTY